MGSSLELGDEGTHVVDFYADDLALMTRVGDHLYTALAAGGTAVAVCTPAHRRLLIDALAASGCEVVRAQTDGALVLLDAAEILDTFLVDGRPEPHRFDDIIGGLVRAWSVPERPLHLYGEMVALLWEAGKVTEAIELETLWNDLGSSVRFDLYCAYHSQLVSGRDHLDDVDELCARHSSVLGRRQVVIDATDGTQASRSFAAETRSAALARSFVQETLAGYCKETVNDVVIATSELAANAVLHSRTDFVVTIARSPDGLRLSVGDTGPGEPTLRSADRSDPAGRGLHLVDSLANRWGVDRDGKGKVVWADFELRVDSAT